MAYRSLKRNIYKIRLKKGDTVIVRSGKYKGKTGKVVATHPTDNKVTVEGINIVKRHLKPNSEHPQGGIIEETKPIHVSNVGVVDPATKGSSKKKPARIGYKLNSKGEKVRFAKQSGKELE
jgi:large subunit ribosomal protein L24